jgi:hypothetical protein
VGKRSKVLGACAVGAMPILVAGYTANVCGVVFKEILGELRSRFSTMHQPRC